MGKLRGLAFNVWQATLGHNGMVERIRNPMNSGGGHMSGIGDGFANLALRPVTVPLSLPFVALGKGASLFFSFRDTLLCFHPDWVKTETSLVLVMTDEKGQLRLPMIPRRLDIDAEQMDLALKFWGILDGKLGRLGMEDMCDGSYVGTVQVLMQGKVSPLLRWAGWNELVQPSNAYAAFHAEIKNYWEKQGSGFARLADWHRLDYNVRIAE